MTKRIHDLEIGSDLTVSQKIQEGKVLLVVLDGVQGKAHVCEAVRHGDTIIETVKGRAAQIKFRDNELL